MYSDIICSALNSFHSYVSRNAASCKNHPAARVSAFWDTHFNDRLNFPTLQQFMTFRQSDFLYGVGDTKQSNTEQKLREFNQTLKSIGLFVPSEFLQHLREPTFGAPQVFVSDGVYQSTSFVLNAGTTWRINKLIQRFGPAQRNLHIVEIGAGWGACACQLYQVADIGSYTVIDLPENLCLSSTYLNVTLSTKTPIFIDCAPDAQIHPQKGNIYFALPPAIDNLPGKYDVVVNTVSFQEMDKETVSEYFAWSSRSLADDGILISLNTHDKEGVRRPSEYLYSGFRLIHMQPFRKVPAGFFNTIPYEMVFNKNVDSVDETTAIGVDVLGEMMQLGLDGNLKPIIESVLARKVDNITLAKLILQRDFFYATDEERRIRCADKLTQTDHSPETLYLVGSYRFVSGDFASARANLEESIELGLQDFAAIRAKTLLALIHQSQGNRQHYPCKFTEQSAAESGGLYEEIQQIIKTHNVSAMQNHIARVLDCPVNAPKNGSQMLRSIKRRLANRRSHHSV